MPVLWVLRHAKAAAHSGADHGRELAPRGRRQCEELAAHLRELPDGPDEVIVSSATRALETAQAVLGALPDGVALTVEPGLYSADADDVVDRLRLVEEGRRGVMVVGHNPTLHDLLLLLVAGDASGTRRLGSGLPTGALAVVDLDVDTWARLAPGTGRLRSLFVPDGR